MFHFEYILKHFFWHVLQGFVWGAFWKVFFWVLFESYFGNNLKRFFFIVQQKIFLLRQILKFF